MIHMFDKDYKWIRPWHEYTRNQLTVLRKWKLENKDNKNYMYKDCNEVIYDMHILPSWNYWVTTAALYWYV